MCVSNAEWLLYHTCRGFCRKGSSKELINRKIKYVRINLCVIMGLMLRMLKFSCWLGCCFVCLTGRGGESRIGKKRSPGEPCRV